MGRKEGEINEWGRDGSRTELNGVQVGVDMEMLEPFTIVGIVGKEMWHHVLKDGWE